jgi:hypothetical protein
MKVCCGVSARRADTESEDLVFLRRLPWLKSSQRSRASLARCLGTPSEANCGQFSWHNRRYPLDLQALLEDAAKIYSYFLRVTEEYHKWNLRDDVMPHEV